MPIDFRATTSNPAFGRAQLPSSQISQYVNQQIIRSPGSAEAKRNLMMPTAEPVTRQSQQVSVSSPTSADAAERVSKTANDISNANRRLMGYSQQARQVREARAAQTPASGGTSTGAVGGRNTYGVPAGVTGSRAKALQLAGSYIGGRYVVGGTSYNGIDCSGLVKVVYNQLGFNIPVHLASWQRDNIPGVRTNNINSLNPGDIVAWRDGSHIAVYAGNGMIIQAANPSQGVIRSRLTDQVGYTPNSVIGIKLKFPGE